MHLKFSVQDAMWSTVSTDAIIDNKINESLSNLDVQKTRLVEY